MQHAFGAYILVDIRPVKPLTIAENREMLSLLRGSLRQAPSPGQRDADSTSVSEVSNNLILRNLDSQEARFCHTTPSILGWVEEQNLDMVATAKTSLTCLIERDLLLRGRLGMKPVAHFKRD
jgi:hypothetical protein